MPLASGTRLGAYDIVAPLGAGGMGEVYHALKVGMSFVHDPGANGSRYLIVLFNR